MSQSPKEVQLSPTPAVLTRLTSLLRSFSNLKENNEVTGDDIEKRIDEENKTQIQGLEVPSKEESVPRRHMIRKSISHLLGDGNVESIKAMLTELQKHVYVHPITIVYKDLNIFSTIETKQNGSIFSANKKDRFDILQNITGHIQCGKLTLVMGPPGSGKTSFLKVISGQLNTNNCNIEGNILYNGDTTDSKNFNLQKVVNFVNEIDAHRAFLTVEETLSFAFRAAYGKTSLDEVVAERSQDASMIQIDDWLTLLGLTGCKDTLVGDAMTRGVSGGEKRRVTLGEMLLLPGDVKICDVISNGLDSATSFDIIRFMKLYVTYMKTTTVMSLLQPSPEVFSLFDDLILLSQGRLIYHGPVASALAYFEELGFYCPPDTNPAEFLQDISMSKGNHYRRCDDSVVVTNNDEHNVLGSESINESFNAKWLADSWRASSLFKDLESNMSCALSQVQPTWLPRHNEKYSASYLFYAKILLRREVAIMKRNSSFAISSIMQDTIIGIVLSLLFSGLSSHDPIIMNGFLFFSCLQGGFSSVSQMFPFFEQKPVLLKQKAACFFPIPIFAFIQSLLHLPVLVTQTLIFSLITYFSVGLSNDFNGARFFMFYFIIFTFGMAMSQYVRLIASLTPSLNACGPICQLTLTIMILFSGYMTSVNHLHDGWIWIYWINPLAYALKAVTVNEYLSSSYDEVVCLDYPDCHNTARLGDIYLQDRGNPTDQRSVWYCIIVLISMYILFLILTSLALSFVSAEPNAEPTCDVEIKPVDVIAEEVVNTEAPPNANDTSHPSSLLYIEPICFTFKNICYSVPIKNSDDLVLLSDVDGCFVPGTMTAIMGSTGAGKTTLLDVLAGRKRTGTAKGLMFANGRPKEEYRKFRKLISYVEQFDSLRPSDTVMEAIAFSSLFRLSSSVSREQRDALVSSIIKILELTPIAKSMIGTGPSGLSLEQRKRISIGMELAANPSVVFLDEPTTALDARSAQIVIRSIKNIAASGRSVVCTIHQPSSFIFNSFDFLLLLKKGGQTAFYGELGESACKLVRYFEGIPGATPCGKQNPAVWMMELIGAGIDKTCEIDMDFHQYYKDSELCKVNTLKMNESHSVTLDRRSNSFEILDSKVPEAEAEEEFENKSSLPYFKQCVFLFQRFAISYMRNLINFIRVIICVVVALLFASVYSNYQYNSDFDTISLVTVMYITLMCLCILSMFNAQISFMIMERFSFYREKQSSMYSPFVYLLSHTLTEFILIIFSALLFLAVFFFIVGFGDDGGNMGINFLWYWLFLSLIMSYQVFFGEVVTLLVANEGTCGVIALLFVTLQGLFCGYFVPAQNIPRYLLFLYYLNPLSYACEGLIVTQFHEDNTLITLYTGEVSTAAKFIEEFYSEWKYENRVWDVLIVLLFIVVVKFGAYLCLKFVCVQKK